MDLSIIIVNWNVKDLLIKSLASIYKYTQDLNFEVFVVDNASTDDSSSLVKKKFPQVHLIQNKSNLGFAYANNQAIKKAHAKYILLLNPDTELVDNSLAKLVEFMRANKDCAILGPQLLNPDKTVQASVRRFPTFWDQFFVLLKLHNFFPNLKPIRKYHMFDFDYQQVSQVDQVMGAALLVKKEIFNKLGTLDEKFWLIFEEADFCQRAKQMGYKIYYTPQAQIIHHKGESFSQHKILAKQVNFNRNLFYYFKKHKPFYQLFFLWLLQPISLSLALLDQSLGIKKRLGKNKDL